MISSQYAKYTDLYRIEIMGCDVMKTGRRTLAEIGLRLFLTLAFLFWLFTLGYFVVFPLAPSVQSISTFLHQSRPRVISQNVATQFFIKLSPPLYEMTVAQDSTSGSADAVSMEYVDPARVTLADLGKKETYVIVESARIHGKVLDGYTQETMMDGFWHYPASSVPGKRGNTVIFGHRFRYLPPNTETFFNLDDVAVGDKVIVEQMDTTISYTVVQTKVVDKTDSSVLASSGDYRLTLITCTPLWTSEKRLVVTAIQDRLGSVI